MVITNTNHKRILQNVIKQQTNNKNTHNKHCTCTIITKNCSVLLPSNHKFILSSSQKIVTINPEYCCYHQKNYPLRVLLKILCTWYNQNVTQTNGVTIMDQSTPNQKKKRFDCQNQTHKLNPHIASIKIFLTTLSSSVI